MPVNFESILYCQLAKRSCWRLSYNVALISRMLAGFGVSLRLGPKIIFKDVIFLHSYAKTLIGFLTHDQVWSLGYWIHSNVKRKGKLNHVNING